MKKGGYRVAVVGATTLAGREVATALVERGFPLATLRLLDHPERQGEEIEIEEKSLLVEPLRRPLGSFDVAFLAGDVRCEFDLLDSLREAGAAIIDCSDRFAIDAGVPLVVPECNAAAIARYRERGLVASPDPLAVALSVVLSPLHASASVRRAVATSMEGVSQFGSEGVEELSQQTIDALQGRSIETAVLSARICFNVLSSVTRVGAGADSEEERRVVAQVRRILGDDGIELSVSRLVVPAFYGIAVALNLELGRSLPTGIAAVLREAPGILLEEGEERVTSLADAVGTDATLVARVRPDPSLRNGWNLWIAIDNLRKGRAANAVQIAEILVRDYL